MKLNIAVLAIFCTFCLLVAGCVTPETPPEAGATVEIIYTNTGQMPMLLATDQIDGYMVWQPFVAVATESGIGKVVSYSQDLPPDKIWEDHTCCALVTQDAMIEDNPALVDAISALFIAADDYITKNQDSTAEITAQWLFGGGEMTFGDVSVDSVDVLKASLPTMKFTTEPSDKWIESNHQFIEAEKELGYITGQLLNATPEEAELLLFDFGPYTRAKAMVDEKSILTPEKVSKPIAIGYLPSDHDAPVFVMIKEWKYFQDNYGIALKPRSDTLGKVDVADLIVNGETITEVKLVRGEGGAQLMTLMASNAIQFADVGTPPSISAIDKGTPIKILHPIQTEGSGFVVAADSPAQDWDSFIEWATQRTAEGKPLKIASPLKGSIQDVQIKYALQDSGVVVTEA